MADEYPDIVKLLRTYLLGPGVALTVPVASRVPNPRPSTWLQLRRIGGTKLPPVRDQPRVDVLAWAPTDPEAWALAAQARLAINALARTTLLGPVCYRVQEFLGPRQADDTATGTPRVLATYTLDVRADVVTPY